jgi:anti-sigma regulatory factor (Ser/Thr protein kinase)
MPYYRCSACGVTSYSAAAYSTTAACPNCAVGLAEDSKLYLVPGAKHDVSRSLLARPRAAAEARRALVGLELPDATRRALALIVSELVSNSIQHAGLAADDAIDLRVSNGSDRVQVAVHDDGAGFAAPAVEERDPLGAGGQGLVIVAALSETWGVDCDHDGCTVWCEVAVPQRLAAAVEHKVTTGYVRELAIEMASAAAANAAVAEPRSSAR